MFDPFDGETPLPQGLTLEQYAQAKRLPIDFLKFVGLAEVPGEPSSLRIAYMDESGSEVAVRFRLALRGERRFRWKNGSRPYLYGLWRLSRARSAGYVVLVESESDAHTLWMYGVPAVALPSGTPWREQWAPAFDGISTIYVVTAPERRSEAVSNWLAVSSLRSRVRLVLLGEANDASALYLRDPVGFRDTWQAVLDQALPWPEAAAAIEAEQARLAWQRCELLAREPRLLDRFVDDLARLGVAGERRTAQLIYLSLVSRLLERPVSVAVKGPSAGGKSFITEQVLRFFPESAYYTLSAASERALIYSQEPLAHRFLVLYEASGLTSDFVSYLVRSLLSEGKLRYETVERTSEGLRARVVERDGPTGLLVTTTALTLHPENETRLLSIPIIDTAAQTKAVMRILASDGTDELSVDLHPWHALQIWLAGGEHRVSIPYAAGLAEHVPPISTRLRRDFRAVLMLIRAHALVHRVNRPRDGDGRVVSTLEDYTAVRDLMANVLASGVEATVTASVRETVGAVTTLLAEGASAVTVQEVAHELHIDKATASRRVQVAVAEGYLRNLELRRNQRARLVIGDPMPDDVEILPSADLLKGYGP